MAWSSYEPSFDMSTSSCNTEYGALRQDFTDFSGDGVAFTVTFKSNGIPIDISADSFYLSVEKTKGVTLFELELGDGIEIIDDGKIEITISSARSALAPDKVSLNYWIRWIRPGSEPETPVFGRMTFARNPTPTT